MYICIFVLRHVAGYTLHDHRNTDIPVSYTHLDVYKRQLKDNAFRLKIVEFVYEMIYTNIQ